MLAGVLILCIWNDGFDRADAAFQTKGKSFPWKTKTAFIRLIDP